MLVINEISQLIDIIDGYKIQKKIIGFVPTMGALHEGHLELIKVAKKECYIVISSIYINPTQFNNTTDLAKYPRTLDSDTKLLSENGCDLVFCPNDGEMYNKNEVINIDFGAIGNVLEGKYRKGHFNGVGLIISKFFNIVRPDIAYFGQKDFQQFTVIKMLVENLKFNVKLRCIPTIRAKSGLALSSRNMRLSEAGKEKAVAFYNSLSKAKKNLLEGISVKEVIKEAKIQFEKEEIELEYFEVVNSDTFVIINSMEVGENAAICVAGYVEGIRLIDNMLLN